MDLSSGMQAKRAQRLEILLKDRIYKNTEETDY